MHLGQNVAKLRGLKRLTQKEVAAKLNLTQPEYSRIEQNMVIEDVMLNRIAEALGIEVESIKNLDEQAAINIVSSVFHDNSSINHQSELNFNPIDKWVEAIEMNTKLYERLLEEKNEIIKQKDEIIEMYKQRQKA